MKYTYGFQQVIYTLLVSIQFLHLILFLQEYCDV